MYEENYIIRLFIFVDDFLKNLEKIENFNKPRIGKNKCGRKRELSISEIVTLGILRFSLSFTNWKDYHRFLKKYLKDWFPHLTNYENFLKYLNETFGLVILLMLVMLRNVKRRTNIQFIDSTDLRVCDNKRISTHKVCKDIAARGKTSKGWFYGFKLHIVCDEKENLLAIQITPGNTDDRECLEKLLKGVEGLVIGDAGYLSQKIAKRFYEKGILLLTGTRRNMKKIMTKDQHKLLKKRQIVETVFSLLKTRMGIVTTLARSVKGLLRHYIYCIFAYILKKSFNDVLALEN